MILKSDLPDATFIISSGPNALSTSGLPSVFLGYKALSADGVAKEGIWAEWTWNGKEFQLTNDRYGFYPLFYFRTKNSFGTSTSLYHLLKHVTPPKLNDGAIAVFLRLGFFLKNDTPFESIHAVPPGCTITWHDDTLNIQTDDYPFVPAPNALSKKAALRAYGELFQAGIARMLPSASDKVGLPLSGGRDSRHILFALLRSGYKPAECLTMMYFPPRPNDDARVAGKIAQALGLKHTLLKPPKYLLSYEIRKNIITHFTTDEHTWLLPLADYVEQENFTLLYDGIGGGVLSDGRFLSEHRLKLYDSGNFNALAQSLLGEEKRLSHILSKQLHQRWNRELAVNHVACELAKYANTNNPIGQFFFWNRTRREIALSPWSILGRCVHVLAPFLNHDVYDLLTTLPLSYFLDHSFHTDTINYHYPKYSSLPYASHKLYKNRLRWNEYALLLRDLRSFFLTQESEHSYVRRSYLILRLLQSLIDIKCRSRLPRSLAYPIYLKQLENLI